MTLFWLSLVLLPALLLGQTYDDSVFECDKGYKVSAIHREAADGKRVGDMTVVCEEMDGDLSGVSCEKSAAPLRCDGKEEPCEEGSYLNGLYGFELDRTTGALLFQPKCCKASNFKADAATCREHRLNSIRGAFNHEVRSNQVYTSFRCWRQYDLENKIHDFIWKLSVCDYELGEVDPNDIAADDQGDGDGDGDNPFDNGGYDESDPSVCQLCKCDCGPFRCPPGRRLHTVVHKRRKRATCQCKCECDFRCV